MSVLMSSAQIREWDQYTIQHEPVSSIDLMERAAKACVQWLVQRWPDTSNNFVVFCGLGNNGGDGLAIARLLLERAYHVDICLVGEGGRSPDNDMNLKELRYLFPIGIRRFNEGVKLDEKTIIIDAIFGTGLNRPAEAEEKEAIAFINTCPQQKVSIDIPSGLNADSILPGAVAVSADHTLTFQQYKLSFLFPETGQHCGNVVVLDIRLHPDYLERVEPRLQLIDEAMVRGLYKKRRAFAHKGTYGHALLVAGSHGKMGACVLAAKACLRSGTGLLSLLVPEDENVIVQSSVPEAMTVHDAAILGQPGRSINAIGIGPGIGTDNRSLDQMVSVLMKVDQPIVLDADALNLLAMHPGLWEKIPEGSLLTPHPKEFDRLFGEQPNSYLRYQCQLNESLRRKVFILLKGHHTCITTPNGLSFFNSNGNPGMAKGGSGDVLTGILTGLLAQYRDMQTTAIIGVYLHGLAGDLALSGQSEESLCASDIIASIGEGFKRLSA